MAQPIKIKISREPAEEKPVPIDEVKEPALNDLWGKIAKASLYLLVFLVPLFFLSLTVNPLQISKQILAVVLVLTAFICYLIRSINTRRLVYPKSWLSLAVLIVLAAVGISAVFSQAPWAGLFGDFLQPDTFLAFSVYALTFFLTAIFFRKEDLAKIGLCFFAGLLPALIFGGLQIFGKFILPWDFSRQTGFNSVGTPFSWGVFLVFGLTMLVAALTSLRLTKPSKIILSLTAFLTIAVLIILNFQLLWIGLALVMFLLAAVKFAAREEMSLPLVIIIISLFFILINQNLPSLVVLPGEVRPDFPSTLSVLNKVLIGKQVLFGSGPATFSFDYSRFRPVELNQTAFWSMRFQQGFSFLFTLPATLGMAGALAFLFLLFSFIRRGLRVSKEKGFLAIVAGLSFLIICLFVYPAFFVQLFFVFLGLGLLTLESTESLGMEFYSGSKWQRARGLAIFLAAILLLTFVLFAFYLAGQKYAAAIYYKNGLFEKAARLDSQSDQYLRTLSQTLLLKSNKITEVSQFQNIIVSALNSGRRAVELNSMDALNWSNLANIYENLIPTKDADVFAAQNYRKAIEREPKNPQGFVDLARVLTASADQSQEKDVTWQEKLNQAKSALQESIGLKADYAPAYFLMAQIYIREGNLDKAIEKVEEIKRTNPGDAGLAFQLGILYYRNNQIEPAQSEFERTVALNENYSNARYFLGLIYDQKGQKQKAIAQFERIKALNPDNQEIKNILDNLKEGRAALETVVPPAQPPEKRIKAPVGE